MTTMANRPRGRPRRAEGVATNRGWHTDDARYALVQAAAAREGRSVSDWLCDAADARLARPDWGRIARRLLADDDVRARLAAMPAVALISMTESEGTTELARIESQTAGDLTPTMWRRIVERIERALETVTPPSPRPR